MSWETRIRAVTVPAFVAVALAAAAAPSFAQGLY